MSYEFDFTEDEMNRLSDVQKDVIIDVMVAGALANGPLGDQQLENLDDELGLIPWGRSDEELAGSIRRAYDKISSFTTGEQAVELIKASAAALTTVSDREKTFALLARVMTSDIPMSEDQQTVLTGFFMGFRLDPARVQQIAAAVKSGT